MIVWGGGICCPTPFNTGGRYNPGTDSWTATSLTNAPDAGYSHTAVWTSSEMIVWGGNGGVVLNTAHTNTFSDPNRDSHTDANCNSNAHGYSELDAQPVSHAEVSTDAASAPDSGTSTVMP